MSFELISPGYLKEQQHLHFDHPKKHKYGTGGPMWIEQIRDVIRSSHHVTVIDYGCGKGLLAKMLMVQCQSYDPAIPEFSKLPHPADLVVCLDVLEHIEPEFLDNVLDHLVSLAEKQLFVAVSLKEAGRVLRDGRNAHLIVKDPEWWTKQIVKRNCELVKIYPSRNFEFVALFNSHG